MYSPESSLYSVVQLYLKKKPQRGLPLTRPHVTQIMEISRGIEEIWKFEVEDEE